MRIEKKRLIPEDKGRLVTSFLEAFFAKYVGYDFTAELEEKLDKISNSEIDWKAVLQDFWVDFSQALGGTKDLRTSQVLDSLNELLGPHIFPARADGGDPRLCPLCGKGQLSLKLGKFGAFIGCSNYPECRFTRVLSPTGQEGAEGERPGVKVLGVDPASGQEVTLRSGRFGDYVQLGEGEKPKRCSLPRGLAPDDVTLDKAVALLSLPREIARHPTDGEPILAGVGRYGAYVQHGKTYANLGRDDDVLEIGANRAIDLIAAKESGASSRFGGGDSGRALGDHPTLGGAVSVRRGRFGVYVNHGKINATLPRGTNPETVTLEEALATLANKASGGPGGRAIGDHPDGGPITLRAGRFGAYVNWGKVNATIPKSTPPEFGHPRRGARTAGRARGATGAQGQGASEEDRRQSQETGRSAQGRRQDGSQEGAGEKDGGEEVGVEKQAQRLNARRAASGPPRPCLRAPGSQAEPTRSSARAERLLIRTKSDRGFVVVAGRRRARKEVDLDLADAPRAKLDVARAEAIILDDVSAPAQPGDQCARHGARRAFGEDARLGRPGVGAVADGVDVRVASFEGARIDRNPAVL